MPLSAAGHDPKMINTDKKYATKVGCKGGRGGPVCSCEVAMTVLAVPDQPTTAPESAAKDASLPADVGTRRPASRSDRPEKKAKRFQPTGRVLGVEEVAWLD
eukprot:g44461.t1